MKGQENSMTLSKIFIIKINIIGVEVKEVGLKNGFMMKAEESNQRKNSKKSILHRNGLHLKSIGRNLNEGNKNGKSNFIKLMENNLLMISQLLQSQELPRTNNF